VCLGHETPTHYLEEPSADPTKKHAETRYTEHVFLHLEESAGHVVGSGAPGA
jgi:hypothetical protein